MLPPLLAPEEATEHKQHLGAKVESNDFHSEGALP